MIGSTVCGKKIRQLPALVASAARGANLAIVSTLCLCTLFASQCGRVPSDYIDNYMHYIVALCALEGLWVFQYLAFASQQLLAGSTIFAKLHT